MDTFILIAIIAVGGWLTSKFLFGGSNSKDEEEEDQEEDEENDEDEDENLCDICERKIRDDEETYECDECGNDNICEDCMGGFENVSLCKSCLKEKCPQKVETKTEYKERIVEKIVYVDKEGIPLNTKFGDPFAKTEFD